MDVTTAFKLGFAMRLGMSYAKNGMASDSAEWKTFKPNGQEGKGRKVLIDGESGQILGGSLPRTMQGTHIKDLKSNFAKQKTAKATNSGSIQEQAAPDVKPKKSIDMTLPDKISGDIIIQNRDRTTLASQKQIKHIAENLDYDMVSASKSIANGAPVVSYGTYPPETLGRVSKMYADDGSKYAFQYAVVDAGDVLSSNREDGQRNEDYFSDDPAKKRVIAGNGRLAGIQYAYSQQNSGTGGKFKENLENYKRELMDDEDHGIDPDVIAKMKNPVLVRVMQPKDITADIGDKSNTSTNMRMSAAEQAVNDVHRVDFENIKTYADGAPTKESTLDFVHKMPVSEQGELIDIDGQPTLAAENRLRAALFQKAYNNDKLTRMANQSLNPDAKVVLNALTIAAPEMAKLEHVKDGYDIRDLISKAVASAVEMQSKGIPLKDLEFATGDLFESEENNKTIKKIQKMIAANSRSSGAIGDYFKKLARTLKEESDRDGTSDLFGTYSARSRDDVIKDVLGQDHKIGKMSSVMADFWRKHGDRFFDKLTCDAFILELKQYRKGIKKP